LRRTYRCIHGIVYDILCILSTEYRLGKTKLCSSANLPLDRCSKLLLLLAEKGLIYERSADRTRFYEITEKGYEYIALYEHLNSLLPLHSQFVSKH